MPHLQSPPISLIDNVLMIVLVSAENVYNFCDLLELINLERNFLK